MSISNRPSRKGMSKLWMFDIRTAKELGYSNNVINMLKSEPDSNRRQRILHDARLEKIK